MAEDWTTRLNAIYLKWLSAVFFKSDAVERSLNFYECSTDHEKANFISDLLDKYPISDDTLFAGRLGKNNDTSQAAREEGNKHYRNKIWHEAIKCFSKSVAYAENDSLDLAMALGNRAACSIQEGYYADALTDVSRALSIPNVEDSYKAKLRFRRDVCMGRIGETKEHPLARETLPEIKSKSKYFENCSSKIQLKSNEEFGRFLEATDNIKTCEVLVVEKPFAIISEPKTEFSYCAHCFSASRVLIPCPGCVTTMYCSKECLDNQKKVHRFECPLLGHLLMIMGVNHLLALRIFIIGCLGETPLNTLTEDDPVDDMYRSSDVHRVFNLHRVERSLKFLKAECFCAAIIVKALRKFTNFFEEFPVTESEARGFVLHFALRSAGNAHQVTYFETEESEGQVIGNAIYPAISLLNHSCEPNVVRDCFGEYCILRAIKPIRKGQQIFDSYCKEKYYSSDKAQRQTKLMNLYGFECKCEACVGNWKFPEEIPYKYQSRSLSPRDAALFHRRATKFELEYMPKFIMEKALSEAELDGCCDFLDYLYSLEIELPSRIHTLCAALIKNSVPLIPHFNRS